ncbi:MAG: hypothetical protein WCQ55_01180 [Paludibacteraceae bacterium]
MMAIMQYKNVVCSFCKKRIVGKYYIDWVGHTICSSHPLIYCASCGQFCDSNAVDIGNGEKVCVHCQRNRIEKNDWRTIAGFIKSVYSKTEIGNVANWHLMMISATELYKKTNDKNTRGLAQAIGSDYTIYVYRELSRVAFAQVLAHEMLHIFQYNQGYRPDKARCEGFCNLGSYVVLKTIGNKEAQAAMRSLETNKDLVYGDGFRLMRQVYEKSGWKGTIEELRMSSSFQSQHMSE